MLTELRKNSQIIVPKKIVSKLGLKEGDKLEVNEKDGVIAMMPVAVYPQKYLDKLRGEIKLTKARIASGKKPVFNNIDDLTIELEKS